jgi:hypothetical protein
MDEQDNLYGSHLWYIPVKHPTNGIFIYGDYPPDHRLDTIIKNKEMHLLLS